jgi:very-short-patch-repair endonuclease
MQFYNQNLIPLRIPKANERLDPPLIDIFVEDGERRGKSKINPREADVIVDEIAQIIDSRDARAATVDGRPRSIGVISLIGAEQALHIQKLLMDRIGEAAIIRHRIVCGDSATLQGDERDIVFISMIADRRRKQSQTAMQYQQRFNVALSRARDRMILVRSVTEEDLNPNDLKARVIAHFRDPMPSIINPSAELIDLCESSFERVVFKALVDRGYRVVPQVGSLGFSIDMVVEGEGDRRLAVECDGDRYHGQGRWADDMRRQRILERVGWIFWRCFGSNFSIDPEGVLDDLVQTLERMEIKPIGSEPSTRGFTQHRVIAAPRDDVPLDDLDAEIFSIQTSRPKPGSNARECETETALASGDRVVIRYIDDERSRPEFYILSEKVSDPKNGHILLSSPLGRALSEATPGDEFILKVGEIERPVLFVSLERESARAA